MGFLVYFMHVFIVHDYKNTIIVHRLHTVHFIIIKWQTRNDRPCLPTQHIQSGAILFTLKTVCMYGGEVFLLLFEKNFRTSPRAVKNHPKPNRTINLTWILNRKRRIVDKRIPISKITLSRLNVFLKPITARRVNMNGHLTFRFRLKNSLLRTSMGPVVIKIRHTRPCHYLVLLAAMGFFLRPYI